MCLSICTHVVFQFFLQGGISIISEESDHLLLQVKYVDSYSVTIHELETVTSKFKFNSMMRGNLLLYVLFH